MGFLWHHVGDGKWSFLMTLDGALAGMVAQCAGCNVYEPWAAMVIGAGAAVAVHGGGGMWGLLCVPFFMSAGLKEGERGIIFDGHLGHPWTVLGVQVAAIAAILAWSIFWSSIIFGSMKMIKMLRVSTEVPLSQQSRFSSHVYFLSILSTGGVQGDGHCEARRISLSSSGVGGIPVQQGRQGRRKRPNEPCDGGKRRDNWSDNN